MSDEVEDVPEPPENWHVENKSDVPEDELEGFAEEGEVTTAAPSEEDV